MSSRTGCSISTVGFAGSNEDVQPVGPLQMYQRLHQSERETRSSHGMAGAQAGVGVGEERWVGGSTDGGSGSAKPAFLRMGAIARRGGVEKSEVSQLVPITIAADTPTRSVSQPPQCFSESALIDLWENSLTSWLLLTFFPLICLSHLPLRSAPQNTIHSDERTACARLKTS